MKWVILTGESGGVGFEILKLLLDEDYGVIGLSRSFSNPMKNVKDNFSDRYVHLPVDLSMPEKIKDLYLNEIKKIGSIYGLVNNAAFAYDDIITNARFASLEKMFTINVHSPFMLTKYAIRDMLLNNVKGSIVHITSVSAHTGYKGLSMYGATKGALEAFSVAIAREWGSKGIRSNCVCPGFMETKMSSRLTESQRSTIYNRNSLKKAIDITCVAETVEFLLSERSSSITGTAIHVDNGTL